MKAVVSLPDSLVEAADLLAERLGVSRSELYARAIEEYLRSHWNEGVTEALNRVYREESSNLDPVIAPGSSDSRHPGVFSSFEGLVISAPRD